MTASSYFTPPAVGELLGVKASKVLGWIGRGELAAVNVAQNLSSRPRWRIGREALDTFLAARGNRERSKPASRRRRSPVPVHEYF